MTEHKEEKEASIAELTIEWEGGVDSSVREVYHNSSKILKMCTLKPK